MRESHAKAYAPWTTAEENDLVLRHGQGEPIDAIAAEPWPQARRHPVPPQETRADLASYPLSRRPSPLPPNPLRD